ncbi:MAG: hypothetical protein LBH12_03740 [Dysgonamonadaceae bacterium]|jgi:hypothetical protein|nr:hypothetical protein [Dysgonamonadaceae bacterium]
MKEIFRTSMILLAFSTAFSSCLKTDGGNYTEYQDERVVVNALPQLNKSSLLIRDTEFLVPDGALDDNLKVPGTCLLVNFRLEGKDKPSSPNNYWPISQLSNVRYVNKTALQRLPSIDVQEDTLAISGVSPYFVSNQKGMMFCSIGSAKIASDEKIEYKLTYVPEEGETEQSIKKVYLTAKSIEKGTQNPSNNYFIHAFDINELFAQSIDTIIGNIDYKFIQVDMKYYIGENEEEEPVWRDMEPMKLRLLK